MGLTAWSVDQRKPQYVGYTVGKVRYLASCTRVFVWIVKQRRFTHTILCSVACCNWHSCCLFGITRRSADLVKDLCVPSVLAQTGHGQ